MTVTESTQTAEAVGLPESEKSENKLKKEHASTSSSSSNSVVDPQKIEAEVDEGPSNPRPITGIKWFLVVCSILSGLFLFSLDNTIVADIQPAIVTRFNSVDKIAWLATAFYLPATSLILFYGQMYSLFNAKWVYIVNVIIFETGSAVCGGAPNMEGEIAGRAIAGGSAMGIYLGVLFLLTVNTTMQERPFYIGLTGAMWGIGTVLGPVVGGAFAQSHGTWRWAFYINLVIGAVTAPVLLFLLPSFDPRPGMSISERLKSIDYLGNILIVGCLTSLVLALQFGGNEFPWNSGRVIACWVGAGVLLILFAISQSKFMPSYIKVRRVFPVRMLFNRTIVLCFCLIASAVTSLLIIIYYLPLFFQFTRGDSPLKSAVRLLPLIFTLVFMVIFGGGTMAKIGYYSPYFILGSALNLVGNSLMFTVKRTTSTSAVYGYSALVGIGTGMYVQAGFPVAQTQITESEAGQCVGFIGLGQLLGGVISLSIAGTVFINQGVSNLNAVLPDTPLGTIKSALAGTSGAFVDSLDESVRTAVLDGIVSAMSRVYIMGITGSAFGLLAALSLKHKKLFLQAGGGGA